jgi:hypothetical protein
MKHCDQVIGLLTKQIGKSAEVTEIRDTAADVAQRWVNPTSGGKEEKNGLIYGLVQSGKTGVLTVTGAIGADEGYRTIIILTSDIDPLYLQTLGRVKEAFPGMDVMGKNDIRHQDQFVQRLKGATCAIVMTKNASLLGTLIENLKQGKVRGLSCLIIDDEADQASLNTREKKADGTRSAVNDRITELRRFFEKNTYLQVTATPQALFLQTPKHDFRPEFTVLSHPGAAYVGGGDFFGDKSELVREFELADITALSGGSQPVPTLQIPKSLLTALDTFMIGATHKRVRQTDQNCAFLCHVSTRTADHNYIESLLWKYKQDVVDGLQTKNAVLLARFRSAFDDLAKTHKPLQSESFDALLDGMAFFAPGLTVKLVNGQTDEDVAVQAPYNLFVGGNKLGRGVTIRNLLVSYYGRNPRRPQADTVLQHARMYGYRRAGIGLLRLFLPRELHTVFKAIHKMERSLRDLIADSPNEDFRGVYIEDALNATRQNVLAPGAIGAYTGGSIYNPAQILRDPSVVASTRKIDELVASVKNKSFVEVPLARLKEIIQHVRPDNAYAEKVWDQLAVAESIMQFGNLYKQTTGYLYVDRDRGGMAVRRETQGILSGKNESDLVPNDKLTLHMLRIKSTGGEHAAWWPQVRFPAGRYAFAFAI